MDIMSLIGILTISGLFGKHKDLELLPPPPPFPKVEEKHSKVELPELQAPTHKPDVIDKTKVQPKKSFFKFSFSKGKKPDVATLEQDFKKRDRKNDMHEMEKLEQELEELSTVENIFVKKEEKHLDDEMENIGKLKPLEGKIPEPIEKPHEILKAEKEIEKAINNMSEEKKPFFNGIFQKSPKGDHETVPSFQERVDSVHLIESMLHKARLALMEFKLDEVRKIYVQIMDKYNHLDANKKSKLYPDIRDLYYERKSAEKYVK